MKQEPGHSKRFCSVSYYDKYFVNGQVTTEADEAYTSHNTKLLDVEGTVEKILTTDYVREQLGTVVK